MKLDDLLSKIQPKQTPQGARLDLQFYIYPDGHGSFYVADENGAVAGEQPFNHPWQAFRVFEEIWNRAINLKSVSSADEPRQPTIAEQFADVIGTVPDLPEDMAAQHDHYIHGVPKS